MCHTCSSSLHAAAHFLLWQGQSNPIACWWSPSSAFCLKFTGSWETLHVLSHGTCLSHGFQVVVPPSTCVGPLSLFREAGAEGCCGRSSAAAEPSAITEGDRMCVGERKIWPCCVGGELGYSILLICLTPGRKLAAKLWTKFTILN